MKCTQNNSLAIGSQILQNLAKTAKTTIFRPVKLMFAGFIG